MGGTRSRAWNGSALAGAAHVDVSAAGRGAAAARLANKALASPSVREKFAGLGVEVVGGTPEQFAAHIRKETVKWADVVRRAGVKVE